MSFVYKKSEGLTSNETHYCPGCTHGTVHKLVSESLVELGVLGETIGIASVGCSVLIYNYIDVDWQQAPHGRAPAVATGVKRVLPNKVVFSYQGDGDLASIGTAEIIHAAARNENITVIFINNAIYGMTGGQMAPTTLKHQVTTTSPTGRNEKTQGSPIKVAELLATIEGAKYIERVSVDTPANIRKSKKAIKRAFQNQIDKKGFSLVEILSTCPTNWKINPVESLEWLESNMIPYFPLGVFKSEDGEK